MHPLGDLAEMQQRAIDEAQEATRLREQAKTVRAEAEVKAKALEAQADTIEIKAAQTFEYILSVAEGTATGSSREHERKTRFEKIRGVLRRQPERDFTSEEIRAAIGEPRSKINSIRASVVMLARRGEVERHARGLYRWKTTTNQ